MRLRARSIRPMSSVCGACTKDMFIARDCSPRLAISAKHATAVGVRKGAIYRGNCAASAQASLARCCCRVARSGEQLVQGRGADGLDQVSLDPRLAREFPARVLTVSRPRNQPQVLQLRMMREMPVEVVTDQVQQIVLHDQDLVL